MSTQLYKERGVAAIVNFIVRLSGKVARTVIFRLDFRGQQAFTWRVKACPLQEPRAGNESRKREDHFRHPLKFGVSRPPGGAVAARRPAVALPGTWAQRRHRGRARPRRAPRIACAAPVTEATAAPTPRRLGSSLRAIFKLS